MSYERYKDYRLTPDDNGCWDVLDKDYQQKLTFPSKAAAKRWIDEQIDEVTPNPAKVTLREQLKDVVLEIEIKSVVARHKSANDGDPKHHADMIAEATDRIITTVIRELEDRLPKEHLPTYKKGKIIGEHKDFSSNIGDHVFYGSGFNAALDEVQSILKEMEGKDNE
jgi:hypothetical protein